MYQYFLELELFSPRFHSHEAESSDYTPKKVAIYINAESEKQIREVIMPNTRITSIGRVKDRDGKPLRPFKKQQIGG